MKNAYTQAAVTTGVIMLMMITVQMLSRLYIQEKLPQMILSGLTSISANKNVILLMVNIFMIIRVCGLIWNVIRNEADLTQRSIEKINLSMLSLQFRTTKTLLLLDESIYYTNNIKILTMDLRKSFDEKNKSRIESSKENLNDIELLMKRFREINNK